MAPYRPPGRSNRSGRTTADNDVFEGLPVKQWGQSFARVSLAPPTIEIKDPEDGRWGEPPMPRDHQMLQPWTQQLLRLARSGKIGTKRKADPENADEDKPEDENAEDAKAHFDDRGYIAKKWKPVAEHMLEPEHKHFEFLAKRRRGLPNFYDSDANGPISMRKTIVQRADANGDTAIYEVLLPEGTSLEGEVTEPSQLADLTPVQTAPGTVIEGVGVTNDDGVVVAEHLKPSGPRRNRPPANKKKGGPGRGKKRVTFTNPDGSTYTTVVPNAQKIVPQPGQTIKHVAKGEEATADVSAEQAAAAASTVQQQDGEDDEDSGSDEGDDDGDDNDDREEGELSGDDAPTSVPTPAAAPDTNGDIANDVPDAVVTEKLPSAPSQETPSQLPKQPINDIIDDGDAQIAQSTAGDAGVDAPLAQRKLVPDVVEPSITAADVVKSVIVEPDATVQNVVVQDVIESDPAVPAVVKPDVAEQDAVEPGVAAEVIAEPYEVAAPDFVESHASNAEIPEPNAAELGIASSAEVSTDKESHIMSTSLQDIPNASAKIETETTSAPEANEPEVSVPTATEEVIEKFSDGDEDLLGNLEKHLEDGES